MPPHNRKRASPDASHADGPPTTKKKTATKLLPPPKEKIPRKLPAKGLVESEDGASFPYRVTWEVIQFNVQRTPKGLENKSFTDCYRNSAYQSLMSIPAVGAWLQKYHGDNHKTKFKDNTDRRCPGCEMLKVYNVVYELDGLKRNEAKQKVPLRQVDRLFSDRDGYFKNKGLSIGQSPHLRTWERLWGRSNIGCDGDRAGQQEAMEFIQFVVEALINRDSRESKGKAEAKFDAEAK
jgi:ubiquitin C-terminal hydrolase